MILLIAGASGAGKSTVIKRLTMLSPRYEFIKTHTTRAPRSCDDEKISIRIEEFLRNEKEGKYFEVVRLYDVMYGSPIEPFLNAIQKGKIAISGTSVHSVNKLAMPNVRIVYLLPPSIDELKRRLSLDNRDADGIRLKQAILEIENYRTGKYSRIIERGFVNGDSPESTAQQINTYCMQNEEKRSELYYMRQH